MTLSISHPVRPGVSQYHRYTNNFNTIQFGKAFKNGETITGLYLDPEPVSHGGLGKISMELPVAFKDELGIKLLKIAPLLEPMKKEKTEKLASFKLKDWRGTDMSFDVVELPSKDGVRRLAIANEELFGQFKSLTDQNSIYQSKKEAVKGLGGDIGLKAYVMFNRAVAELLNKHSNVLKQKLDFVIGNDWMATSAMSQLQGDADKLKRIYFFHNHYDEVRKTAIFDKLGLQIPEKLKHQVKTSLASIGLNNIDVIIANQNYFNHVTQTDLAKGRPIVEALKHVANKVQDMHHGLLNSNDPRRTPALQVAGFTNLKNVDLNETEIKRFKDTNKAALQKQSGLKVDPSAILFFWNSRFDPFQKGCDIVIGEVEKFLKDNPKAQVLLNGLDANDKTEEALNSLAKKPELNGRLVFKNGKQPFDRVIQGYAGSDFYMMPSLYEPFGLTQLEAMKLGAVPVVNDVDGIKTTTSDPERNNGQKEPAWDYGQIALKMKPISVVNYLHSFNKQLKLENGEELTPTEQAVMKLTEKLKGQADIEKQLLAVRKDLVTEKIETEEDAQNIKAAGTAFREALDRAITLASSADTLNKARLNGMKYVDKEHTWDAIAKRYYVPMFKKLFPSLQEAKTT